VARASIAQRGLGWRARGIFGGASAKGDPKLVHLEWVGQIPGRGIFDSADPDYVDASNPARATAR
jgi:hypothetical protein